MAEITDEQAKYEAAIKFVVEGALEAGLSPDDIDAIVGNELRELSSHFARETES